MLNETLKAIGQRASCKGYAATLPKRETLEAIALAAAQSPSAVNLQPWKIIVVTDRELILEIEKQTVERMATTPGYEKFYEMVTSTGMDMSHNAPCMLILAIDGKNQYAQYDCGIAAQSVCIAAQSLGVASHIVAINALAFDGEKGAALRERLQFPEGYVFGLGILLGYATQKDQPHEPCSDKIVFV